MIVFLEEGSYQVTVTDVSYKTSQGLGVCGVALLTVEVSDNPTHPQGSQAQFLWRKRGFDYSELEEYVGEKLYVQVKALQLRGGRTFLNHIFTKTALDATVGS